MNPDNFEAANLFYTKRPRMNEQIHWVHVDRRPNCVIAVLDFLKVLYFFSWFGCHFKGLFIPVLREIRRSKILPVTSSLTNRTASDISRHSICQSFSSFMRKKSTSTLRCSLGRCATSCIKACFAHF